MKIRKCNGEFFTLMGALLALGIIGIIILCNMTYRYECVKCGLKINEGFQFGDYWLCNRCTSMLERQAEEIWGNAVNKDRMDWIIESGIRATNNK